MIRPTTVAASRSGTAVSVESRSARANGHTGTTARRDAVGSALPGATGNVVRNRVPEKENNPMQLSGRALIPSEPFDSERSPFNRQMAAGHEIRHGHKLVGHYVSAGYPGVVKLVRTCCPIVDDCE